MNFGNQSFIKGDFELPNFSDSSDQELIQLFSDVYIDLKDLKAIQMPDSIDPITFDPTIDMNKFLSISKARL